MKTLDDTASRPAAGRAGVLPARPWPRRLHRGSGMVLGAFALLHLANHLVALAGVPAHQQAMRWLRLLYRHPLVEPLLLLCVLAQVGSGLWSAWRVLQAWRGGARPRLPAMQAASGLVLGGFLIVHVGAVLAGRGLLGLDTDFFYAAAGLHVAPFGWFFGPYYFAGVAALGLHLGCVAARARPGLTHVQRQRLAWALGAAGAALGLLLCLLLAGAIVPVEVPARYRASFA